ncbi:MAG: ASCH domain-containing protein [Anaerolineales bacterium]|nr:ASCH domain-containing protein [Anaerolineales bacterium]
MLRGEKRATAGLKWSYEAEDESLPEIGQLSVITNWNGDPQCIVEVTSVEIMPYNEVSADFAIEEGEGDKSLEFWRRVHWEFFSMECADIGREPTKDMPVILEKFKIRWKE